MVSEPFQIRPQNLADASKNPCMLFFVVVRHTGKVRGTNTGSRKGKEICRLSGALRAWVHGTRAPELERSITNGVTACTRTAVHLRHAR